MLVIFPRLSSYQIYQEKQNYGANCGYYYISNETATERNSQPPENITADESAYHADNNITEQSEAAPFHQTACDPARD